MAESRGGELAYVARPGVVTVDSRRLQRRRRSPGWADAPDGIALYTPGEISLPVEVPGGGRWRIWLKGEFGREVTVSVDGEEIGGVSYESGNEGNYAEPMEADLTAGTHRLKISRGGGSPAPGDATPSRLSAVVLEPEPAREPPVVETIPPSQWRDLCDRNVDWIEVVSSS
jgi:hypothetical protein